MEDNCTGFKSESQDFLKALRPSETALLAVCGSLVLVDVIIFFDNVAFLFCKHRVNQIRTSVATVTWLVALCPILAFICFMSMVIPNAFLFRDVLSTGCISVVMFKFVELASVYIKHYDGLREHIRDNQRLRFDVQPFACCCKCLPTAPMNRPRVLFLKGLVLQFPLVTLPISILTVYLWVDNKYNMGEYAADSPWVYLTVIKVVSTLTAMYGLGVLYAAVREPLSATYISQKYMALKLCALLNNIQHFVFRILSSNDVFHSRECFTGRVMGD
ncbi:organic solute transporter subunit alpha, partial [Plakobranchus ocellatus]